MWTRQIITITFVSHVTMKQPIINKDSIFAGDNFTVTCDINRFDNVPATVDAFTLMSVGHKNHTDYNFKYIANYTPYNQGVFAVSKPTGGFVTANYSDRRLTPDQLNRDTVRVSLAFYDAPCSQAGWYQCLTTGLDGTRTFSFISEAVLMCKEPVVDKRHFVPGEVFTVKCDSSRFRHIPSRESFLFMMSMKRRSKLDDTYQVLASYLSQDHKDASALLLSSNDTPIGRKWDFRFAGGVAAKGLHHRGTLNITLTVHSSCCTDTGQYLCVAQQEGEKYVGDPFNVTCHEPVVQGILLRTPSTRPGNNVMYTCTFSGLPDLRVVWKVSIAGIMPEIEYPYSNQTSTIGPLTGYNCLGCQVAIYTSRLEFAVSPSDNGTTYSCVVYDRGVERSRTNATLYVSEAAGWLTREAMFTTYVCLVTITLLHCK